MSETGPYKMDDTIGQRLSNSSRVEIANAAYAAGLQAGRAEGEKMREALQKVPQMLGHNHWDHTMQHGAGCELCIKQYEIMREVRSALEPTR